MKKILFTVIFALILLSCTFGQDLSGIDNIHITDTGTMEWDDNSTYLSTDSVAYEIYISEIGYPDEYYNDVNNLILLGSSETTSFDFDISKQIRYYYYMGVRVVVTTLDEQTAESKVYWSVDEDAVDPLSGRSVFCPRTLNFNFSLTGLGFIIPEN